MPKATGLSQDWLDHYFLNSAIANVGDATGLPAAGTAGNVYVDLVQTWPVAAGTISGNVADYTNYVHVAVPRNSGGTGWQRASQTMENEADIEFAQCGASGNTVRHWGVKRATGSSVWDYFGPLATEDSEPFVSDTSVVADHILTPGRTQTLVADDEVVFTSVIGGTLPVAITEGTVYYVGAPTANDFQIDDVTPFAAALTVGDGEGRYAKVVSKVVTENDTPKITANTLEITES